MDCSSGPVYSGRVLLALLCSAALGACSLVGDSLDRFTSGGTGPQCSQGLNACGSDCVDTNSDPNHCGKCGNACPSTQVCDNGQCTDACSGGHVACDRACVDLSSNPLNCGACGAPCTGGKACTGGQCQGSCASGQTLCDGLCVDTQSNSQHCGDCGTACPTARVCTAGKCTVACPGGQVACNGLCYDLQTDLNHCGSCTNPCKSGEVCGNGKCALSCPSGQTPCNGACVDLQTSVDNCGSCGTPCTSNQECSGGKCVVACKTLLNQPITDPWGTSWDGLERAATDLSTAEAACAKIGGRLPTASELYRVSATQSATVGQTINTNFLWSIVPYDQSNQIRVRLSDANVSSDNKTASLNYRCVCPAPLPHGFTGNNCYGASGQGCFAVDGEGKRLNMDVEDRPPLPVGSAIWECAFNHAHLANSVTLFEAIQQGLPNGSNSLVQTSDMARFDQNIVMHWQDVAKSPTVGASTSWGSTTGFRPFRCVGANYDSGTHPGTVPNKFTAPTTPYVGETVDSAAAGWAAANDACFSRGGHVPRAADLAELIQQGLPGGSGAWLWSSDQTGFNGANFLVESVRWTRLDRDFGFANPNDINWVYKTSTNPLRCVYYPVDTSYKGPQTADCAGGCTPIALPDGSGAEMWFDSYDRAPSATLESAIDTCRQKGGHLASERDLIEAIRHGLPNGSGTGIWTSDLSVGQFFIVRLWDSVVMWTGTNRNFADQYGTESSWSDVGASRPYRCMWTNELR